MTINHQIVGWDESSHFEDDQADETRLPPLSLEGLRLRMQILMCRVWPNKKMRDRMMLVAERDEFMPEWGKRYQLQAPEETAGAPIDVRFFRAPCRLMAISGSGNLDRGTVSRFDGMLRLVLQAGPFGHRWEPFGVFPFHARHYNGKLCIPVPSFLADMRPTAAIQLGTTTIRRRLAATVIYS